jgi:hypothetical protein
VKILYWSEKYEGIEGRRNVIRKTVKALSLKAFSLDYCNKVLDKLFQDTIIYSVEVSRSSETQIRVPKLEYERLIPQIKSVLVKNSVHVLDNPYYESGDMRKIYEEWKETNYWKNCKAYIFDFDSYRMKMCTKRDVHGGADYKEEIRFMKSIHPFIDEFIDCFETRWGEAGEIENIKKWQVGATTQCLQA